jgi:hypothetical protein
MQTVWKVESQFFENIELLYGPSFAHKGIWSKSLIAVSLIISVHPQLLKFYSQQMRGGVNQGVHRWMSR